VIKAIVLRSLIPCPDPRAHPSHVCIRGPQIEPLSLVELLEAKGEQGHDNSLGETLGILFLLVILPVLEALGDDALIGTEGPLAIKVYPTSEG